CWSGTLRTPWCRRRWPRSPACERSPPAPAIIGGAATASEHIDGRRGRRPSGVAYWGGVEPSSSGGAAAGAPVLSGRLEMSNLAAAKVATPGKVQRKAAAPLGTTVGLDSEAGAEAMRA